MSLHEPSLEEMVHELIEDNDQLNDPYSAAMVAIKAGLSYGLEQNRAINEREFQILMAVRIMLFALDPRANPDYLAPGITGPFKPDVVGPYTPEHSYEAEAPPHEGEFINCKWCGKPKGLHTTEEEE